MRGRVAFAIDSTATIIETRELDQKDEVRGHPLRLQYSMALTRLVNGITDSTQRGRVASSVASLAAAASLPRNLVDIRHQSTHNDLPSISSLRTGSKLALQWLKTNYWEAQLESTRVGEDEVTKLVQEYIQLHIAAVQSCDTQDNSDDSREESSLEEYNAAHAKRRRKSVLVELNSRVPGSGAPLLLPAILNTPIEDAAQETGILRAVRHLADIWPDIKSGLLAGVAPPPWCSKLTRTTFIQANHCKASAEICNRKRWRKVRDWESCALGMLPSPVWLNGVPPNLDCIFVGKILEAPVEDIKDANLIDGGEYIGTMEDKYKNVKGATSKKQRLGLKEIEGLDLQVTPLV